jgi:hypothetical protein
VQLPEIPEIRRAIFGGALVQWTDHNLDAESGVMTSTATFRGLSLVRAVDKKTKHATYRAAPTGTNEWRDFEVASPEGVWLEEDGPLFAAPDGETLRLRSDAEDREVDELRAEVDELRRRLDVLEARG